jgi:hypothetical protein
MAHDMRSNVSSTSSSNKTSGIKVAARVGLPRAGGTACLNNSIRGNKIYILLPNGVNGGLIICRA